MASKFFFESIVKLIKTTRRRTTTGLSSLLLVVVFFFFFSSSSPTAAACPTSQQRTGSTIDGEVVLHVALWWVVYNMLGKVIALETFIIYRSIRNKCLLALLFYTIHKIACTFLYRDVFAFEPVVQNCFKLFPFAMLYHQCGSSWARLF